MRVSAFREALDMFDPGLALLARESPSGERASLERAELERLLGAARLGPCTIWAERAARRWRAL